MFFGFQLTLGLMMAFYGFSVMKNPRVWGDQGRKAVKAENFEEYCRQNGQFCTFLAWPLPSTPLPAGASRTRVSHGRGPTSKARKSASKSCAANSRHRRTRKKGRSDPPDKA